MVVIKDVLIVGAGSAGLIAGIALRRKLPGLKVRCVRSPEVGVIGVGEATTPNFPKMMFNYLGINRKFFFQAAEPTWKLGIHFLWGPRKFFNYGFSWQCDARLSTLPRCNGYYCEEDFTGVDQVNTLMELDKAFMRGPDGAPIINMHLGFHLENKKLVAALEVVAREVGVEFIDAKIQGAEKGPEGISAVILEDGRRLVADFYVDASGFKSLLLGKTLEEPFVSFGKSLFCDRAIVGNWERPTGMILPYTTAETMDSGWCWRIDHENHVNRGYVYSSAEISDEAAREELVKKNPGIVPWDHVVKFRSGRYQREWVGNVLAVGNAGGFVEPLESSSLMMVCWNCETMVTCLEHSGLNPTPSMRRLYNKAVTSTWDQLRDFLALHYHTNTRLETPFWKKARAETDISGIRELMEFYDENGPTGMARDALAPVGGNFFGIEGFLVILVGTKYPYRGRHVVTAEERRIFEEYRARVRAEAAAGGREMREVLRYIKSPNWRWGDG
jgi:tryptophan halogenase